MEIILINPQIPQNTGNIVRTCSVTGSSLVLVKPLGFQTSNRMLKRAGLDYWNEVQIQEIDNLNAYLKEQNCPFYFFSSKGKQSYSTVQYEKNSILIFGSETSGFSNEIFELWPDRIVTIPMSKDKRCLNLSNAVAIGLYEAWRQNAFTFLQRQ